MNTSRLLVVACVVTSLVLALRAEQAAGPTPGTQPGARQGGAGGRQGGGGRPARPTPQPSRRPRPIRPTAHSSAARSRRTSPMHAAGAGR